MTDQQYYENSSNWGDSQFISLKNIIDNILILADDDDYLKNLTYFRASILAKQGLKKLNLDIQKNKKALAITVHPSKIFPFPRYMTNWIRISVINNCGNLVPLNINNTPEINNYLQNNDSELLYDCEGNILEGSSFDAKKGDCCIKIECEKNNFCGSCKEEDFSKSWIRENKKEGYFSFSDDLVDRDIVIEYIASGLQGMKDCDIKIHNDLEMTLTYYIKWKATEGKKNTSDRTSFTYKQEYKIEKRRSEQLLSEKITLGEIINSVSRF